MVRTFSDIRGFAFVTAQVVLLAAFIVLPEWRPEESGNFFDESKPFRQIILVLFEFAALVMGLAGAYGIRKFITPFPKPVEHNELVTTGLYALVRHPLYGSILSAGTGWALYNCSIPHMLMMIGAMAFFSFKAGYEETLLQERHPEYSEYRKHTKKFFPFIY